jgi:putative tributyrin esterase
MSCATLAAIAIATVFLSGCQSARQLLPDYPRQSPGVKMQDVSFHSAALNRDMPYRVYLPAKLIPGRKLPVVYLLHGSGGSFQNWSNYSDVAHYAGRGLILVMPDGGSSYYVNAALKPEDRYEDYLVNDLISDVETRFPAAKGRENRAIVGVSMGGFAAAKLALSHPGLFVFAGAISPAIDVPSRRFTFRRWDQGLRFRTIFGPPGSQSRQASDPFVLVQSANAAATPYIFITAGEQEPLLDPIRRFAARLQARHFVYEFHTKPGAHTWSQWDAQIPACFESLLQHLSISYSEAPSSDSRAMPSVPGNIPKPAPPRPAQPPSPKMSARPMEMLNTAEKRSAD